MREARWSLSFCSFLTTWDINLTSGHQLAPDIKIGYDRHRLATGYTFIFTAQLGLDQGPDGVGWTVPRGRTRISYTLHGQGLRFFVFNRVRYHLWQGAMATRSLALVVSFGPDHSAAVWRDAHVCVAQCP